MQHFGQNCSRFFEHVLFGPPIYRKGNGVVGGLVEISNAQTRYMLQMTQFEEETVIFVSFCSTFLVRDCAMFHSSRFDRRVDNLSQYLTSLGYHIPKVHTDCSSNIR